MSQPIAPVIELAFSPDYQIVAVAFTPQSI